jgi:hypothetical protein
MLIGLITFAHSIACLPVFKKPKNNKQRLYICQLTKQIVGHNHTEAMNLKLAQPACLQERINEQGPYSQHFDFFLAYE